MFWIGCSANVGVDVNVESVICVPAIDVLSSANAVSITSVGFVLGGNFKPAHDVDNAMTNIKRMAAVLIVFNILLPFLLWR